MTVALSGTILRCDLRGMITEIIADGLNISGIFAVDQQIDQLVAETDTRLAQDFIASLRGNGAVFDCMMAVDQRGWRAVLRFEGSKIDQQLVVTIRPLSNSGLGQAHQALDSLSALNNRLVNQQRALARALAGAGTGPSDEGPAVAPPARPGIAVPVNENFSPRERDVVAMLLAGLPNRQIGEQLGIEESAVKARLRSIYRKLAVSSRAQAVMVLIGNNLARQP